ncbi:MAG: hypothetical protein CVT94_15340 [Bacteroidetes bacterium HGW-Bacteroidetes-11]|nr:MAG: hypothetical protein CVT94_15340 [Bacteroidetes bacterium HGW-Bacteroidetes-11]
MKILVIRETNPFATSNASNNRFLSLAEGLAENGARVDLIIIQGYSTKFEKLLFHESKAKNGLDLLFLSPVYIYPSLARKIINKFLFRNYIYVINKIIRLIKNIKYDYIWIEPGNLTTRIGITLKLKKKDIFIFQERSEFSWIGLSSKQWQHTRYLKKFMPQVDAMAVMTITLLNYYKNYLSEKARILHLPMTVDFARFDNIPYEKIHTKTYIAYCGTMNNEKDGVDILVKSFVKIMDKHPEIHLYIAGSLLPESDYQVQKLIIMENNAGNRITYLGSLTKEEIPPFLFSAKVLAMARPNSKQAEGGFPTKLGEYLATGNPVCVTLTGEIGDYLIDNVSAFIAEPDSVDSFANALDRALTFREASKIGENGRNVALKHFNKEIQSANLFNFLSQSNS